MDPRTNPVLYFLQQIYTIQCTRLAFRAQQPNLVCFPSLIPVHLMPRLFHPMHTLSMPLSVSIFCAGAAPWAFRPNTPRDGKIPRSRMMRLSRLSIPDLQHRPRKHPIMQTTPSAFALRLEATHCGTAVTHKFLKDAVHPRHHRRLAGWPCRGQLALLSFPSKPPPAVPAKL